MQIRWISGIVFSLLLVRAASGANFATPNFVAHAEDSRVAEQVARTAEFFRKRLAQEWTGAELPKWSTPCPIQVTIGTMGASGSTTFTFEDGHVHSWDMRVRGSLERVLDSVVPHEVCHTIFASKFRRPLPRWADEGAATLVEHPSERLRQVDMLNRVFNKRQQMPLQTLFGIREYPSNPEALYTLYAEGYSLAEFLVQQKSGADGKRVYLTFLGEALDSGWEAAIRRHYGYKSVEELELSWGKWVMAGSPSLPRDVQYAFNETSSSPDAASRFTLPPPASALTTAATRENVVIRSQSPKALAPLDRITRQLRNATAKNAPEGEDAPRSAALRSLNAPEPASLSSGAGPVQLRLPLPIRAAAR